MDVRTAKGQGMEVMQVQGETRLDRGSVSGVQVGGQAMAADEGGAGESGFNKVMKTWARWMTLADHQHSNGWANPQDVKEFMACGTAVESMIDDLPRIQWWAVRKAFGIATVWRFPDYSFEQALEEAERTLSKAMQRNIATRRYFH